MKYISFLILLLALSHSNDNKSIRDDVINNIFNKYININSVSFDINIKNKMLYDIDTSETTLHCKYIKIRNDKTFNGILSTYNNKNIDKYFINNKLYYVYHNESKISIYDNIFNNEDSIKQRNIKKYFKGFSYNNISNPIKLLSILNDTLYQFSINEESKYYCFRKEYPDEGDISNAWNEILINKEYDIISNTLNVRYKGFNQWEKAMISNISFNNIDAALIRKRLDSLLQIYEVTYSSDIKQHKKKKDSTQRRLLKNNSEAPDFSGFYYQGKKNVNLVEYRGKIIIIDFWYTSCIPCNIAIPHLNELFDKYKGRGLVILGLNKYDNTPERRKALDMYLTKQTVKYPIILTEKSKNIDSLYKVWAYPTMYLLDSNLKVLYSKVGFSEESMDTLEMIIKEYLKIEE